MKPEPLEGKGKYLFDGVWNNYHLDRDIKSAVEGFVEDLKDEFDHSVHYLIEEKKKKWFEDVK